VEELYGWRLVREATEEAEYTHILEVEKFCRE